MYIKIPPLAADKYKTRIAATLPWKFQNNRSPRGAGDRAHESSYIHLRGEDKIIPSPSSSPLHAADLSASCRRSRCSSDIARTSHNRELARDGTPEGAHVPVAVVRLAVRSINSGQEGILPGMRNRESREGARWGNRSGSLCSLVPRGLMMLGSEDCLREFFFFGDRERRLGIWSVFHGMTRDKVERYEE